MGRTRLGNATGVTQCDAMVRVEGEGTLRCVLANGHGGQVHYAWFKDRTYFGWPRKPEH